MNVGIVYNDDRKELQVKYVRFILTVVLVLAGGCHIFVEYEDYPAGEPPAERQGVDFMPLAVGNSWTYGCTYYGTYTGTGPPDSTVGRLTWRVHSRTSVDDTTVYLVEESFEGRYRAYDWHAEPEAWGEPVPHTWTRDIEILDTPSGVLLHVSRALHTAPFFPEIGGRDPEGIPWNQAPVRRYYETPADTVCSTGEENYPLYRHQWCLVKHQGIASFDVSMRGSGPAGVEKWSLQLIDYNVRGDADGGM